MKHMHKTLFGLALMATLGFVAPTLAYAESGTGNLPAYDLQTKEEAVRVKYSFYIEDELVSEQTIVSGNFLYEPEAKVINGKVFVGWFDEDDNKIDFWSSISVSESGEKKIVAKYEDAGIVAHFVQEIDGKDVVIASQVAGEDGKISLDVEPDLKISEYLRGWDDNGTIVSPNQEITITESKIYRAVIENKVWVEFETGENATEISAVAVVPGSTVSKPANPERKGYEFVEWQLNGAKYDFSRTVNSDITLEAVWKPVLAPYTIVVRRENTEGEMKPVQIILDREAETESSVTVSADDEEINFSDIDYYEPVAESVTETIAGDGTTVFIVEFKRKEYTFEFDFESNTGFGALAGQRYLTDGAGNQHSSSEGYSFSAKIGDDISQEWATTVGNMRNTFGVAQRFYAWMADNLPGRPYFGGNIRMVTPDMLSTTEDTINLSIVYAGLFERPYNSPEQSWTPANEVEEPEFETEQPTYYSVTIDLDGGEGEDAPNGIRVLSGEYADSVADPTKDGYTFGGWKDKDTDETFDFEKVKISKDTNIIATWISNKDIIRVCYVDVDDNEIYDELNYTDGATAIVKEYEGGRNDLYPAFVGWRTDSDSHVDAYTELFEPNGLISIADYAINGIVRLVAAFDYPEPTAEIYYNSNYEGSEEYLYFDGIKRNADYEIIPNSFEREGYNFVEWNTMSDGSGKSYQPGELLALDTDYFTNELFAIWEEKKEEPVTEETTTTESTELENPVTYDGINLYIYTFIFAGILAGAIMFAKQGEVA
ncbi:InlB B-repeat-containing protein [Candidatus Saccharibacteria bacterium]|nr:InlB B-repeat-containing protein [Candidatus Saccharibacteria bacterium]